MDVADYAWMVAEGDKRSRRRLYEQLGMAEDETVTL
jgi:hypothetical protein